MIVTLSTSAGPIAVAAAEPSPGLRIFEIPANVSPLSPCRWILAHHEGTGLAAFETKEAATLAAEKVAPLADWTRNAITAANEIGPGAGMEHLMALLRVSGGRHPNT
ncbi:hypothetical protein ACFU99_08620 [Streptomyces sp. NPDC057654]|uniref:hypothetical protein n=1 Tax=Streptomyces sp. NPDC057654 TaxID=3346196 RepID=UPI003688DBA8